jgi:alpha-tubulin suppressor-like RCC1 family protein
LKRQIALLWLQMMRRRVLKLLIAFFITLVLIVVALSAIVFRSPAKLVAESQLPEGNVKPQLAGRADRAALIAPDGSLWAWGGTYTKLRGLTEQELITETPVRVGPDNDWAQVSLGARHTVAIRTNGTLWGWGIYNVASDHQHEPSNQTTHIPKPVLLGAGSNWVQIAAGDHHSLALNADGTLWVCGKNASGQLGDGTTNDRFELKPVNEDTDWKVIAAGTGNSFAIKQNGTLWSWGSDASGTKGDALSPVQIDGGTNWIDVDSASFVFAGLKADGTIWLGGHNAKFHGSAIRGCFWWVNSDWE